MPISVQDIKLIIVDLIAELCTELEERFASIKAVIVICDRDP